MSNKRKNVNMSPTDFHFLIRKIKKSTTSQRIKLMGGEPTLHSRFPELIQASLKSFETVELFTNGVISNERARFLIQYDERIHYIVNVMTPGFMFNRKIRTLVIKRIKMLSNVSTVTFAFTIDPFSDINFILRVIPKTIWKRILSVRIGIANPIRGAKNWYSVKDFPNIGTVLVKMKQKILHINPNVQFVFGCGFTRCMFTDEQYAYISNIQTKGLRFGCFGKGSSMDVATNLRAFHCFPLSSEASINVKRESLTQASKKLLIKRLHHWWKKNLPMCKSCPYYGTSPESCPGPCIAWRYNASLR